METSQRFFEDGDRMIRLLVVANETIEGRELHAALRDLARGPGADVLVVAPALNSRLRHWLSDTDPARRNAQARLERCLGKLREAGLRPRGQVGDADPLQAIEDALAVFPANMILISTHPESRSNWLAQDLIGRARNRFGLPVRHVVSLGEGITHDAQRRTASIRFGSRARRSRAAGRPGRSTTTSG